MKIVYRRIESTESKIFRRVRLEALKNFPESFGTLYEEEAETPQLYFEGIIERGDFTDIFFFGAFADDGELLGIAGFARQTRAKSRHRGDIISMYVNPNFQERKIGENLLHALMKTAFGIEGVEQIQLSVVTGNRAAVHLYEKNGFETCGVQKDFFKCGEKYWDLQSMQLMKKDFLENKNAFFESEM